MNPFFRRGLNLAAQYANGILKDPKVQGQIIEKVSNNTVVKAVSKKAADIAVEYTPPKHATGKFKDPMYYAGYKVGEDVKKLSNKTGIIAGNIAEKSLHQAARTSTSIRKSIKDELDRRKR